MSQESLSIGVKTKSAYWLSHFEKWVSSSLSQEKYCEQQKIGFAKFGYWRTKLRTPSGGIAGKNKFVS